MERKALEQLLLEGPFSLHDLVKKTGETPEDLGNDLDHLIKTLRNEGNRKIEIEPAYCRKCDFRFSEDHFTKPTKCPSCNDSWIKEPRFRVVSTP